ncbi:L,D-transpeptidase family protein [Sphingomonas sp.]|jgi:lipoprotein-anchoring transpeptidase ErfK/SrfK|uniref:L,D-transpeptidase family protein n=1 Tax=Sphingomonas sp. TaxID=28214 RepID=UPI002D80684B|nr:L,D-transpeptidase family protein [Sphingomonas sp.]HEU0044199.1 L,D-transpeptidase family protein [Sphingomonas sp.]
MSSVNRSVATLAAVLMGLASPAVASGNEGAVAVETAAVALGPNQFVWTDTASADPVNIVINIAEQRAYVYRGETLIAATTVSTGKDGKDTPSGTFTILQKKIDHKSNLYDSAPMPFMQRLTWDGVAIHAGKNPGYPASHGCIRVPLAFAKKLYGITAVGTTVTVVGADGEIAPTVYDGTGTASETASANKAGLQVASR